MSADNHHMNSKLKKAWKRWGQWAVGLLVVNLVAWASYTGDHWIRFLSEATLGFHELGHAVTMIWAPRPLVSFAGSFLQVAVPLGLAAYFYFKRSDLFAVGIMFVWAGYSLNDVSVYIYDATRRVLPLLGDQSGHDWAYLLGPNVLDALPYTDTIANIVRFASALFFIAAAGIMVYGLLLPMIERKRTESLEEYRDTLPVREPRQTRPVESMGTQTDIDEPIPQEGS